MQNFDDFLNWFDVTYYNRVGVKVTYSYYVPPIDFDATCCSLFDAWYILSKVCEECESWCRCIVMMPRPFRSYPSPCAELSLT